MSVVLVVYALLWIPSVQQGIKNIAVSELNKMTNGKISIRKFSLRPFNKVVLEGVFIPDLKNDTLLYAEHLSAGFSLPELLHNRLLIKSVRLEDFTAGVSRDSVNAPFNFQFLIDAFASSDTTQSKPSSLVIEIDDISLVSGKLSYDIHSQEKLPEGFDSNHIHIYDFNTNISLKSIKIESLDARLKSLSFKESSGLFLKNLTGKISSDGKIINAENWDLQFPDSELKIDKATVDYTGMEIGNMMDSARYSVSLNIPKFLPADFQAFYLPLKNSEDLLNLSIKASGKFPAIDVETISVKFGKFLSLQASAQMDDFQKWDKSLFDLYIKNLTVNNKALGKIMDLMSVEKTPAPQMGIQLETIKLMGRIKGSLPNANLNIVAETSTGNLNLKGTGGYVMDKKSGNFNVNLLSENFNLKALLNNPSLGLVSLNLNASGNIVNGNINARTGVRLNRFDFNGYSYKNIHADAAYQKDSAGLLAVSKDPKLTMVLKTKVKGFNPEKMNADLAIDSLLFTAENGIIRQGPIRLSYNATANSQKTIKISSDILNGNIRGRTTLSNLAQAFTNTMSSYLPAYFTYKKTYKKPDSNLKVELKVNNTEDLTNALNLPFSVIEPALITASYNEQSRFVGLNMNMPEIKVNNIVLTSSQLDLQTDTLKSKMHLVVQSGQITGQADSLQLNLNSLAGHDSISIAVDFKSITPDMNIHGALASGIHLVHIPKQQIPDMFINILPTSVYVNQQVLQISPSKLAIQGERYEVDNFKIGFSDNEYLSINGKVSKNENDTLIVNSSRIQLQTLTQALRSDIDLTGEIDGRFVLTQLLTVPRFFTNDFTVKDIMLADQKIGTINLSSLWNSERKGIGIKATLTQENALQSEISGFIIPALDSLAIKANINAIQLDWLSPFTQDYLYGLAGTVESQLKATGKLSSPTLSGNVSFKDARLGVKMTNVLYTISDNIVINPDNISLKNFKISDQNNNSMTINGDVKHHSFTGFTPDLKIRMRDFQLLNNPSAIDSLFYGTLRLNGSIDVTGSDKDLLVNMVLSNSGKGKVFVKIPDSETQAQQFTSITFINPADSLPAKEKPTEKKEKLKTTAVSLPIKLKIALSIDPQLTLGTIINPDTRDEASVSGTGNIDFSYNLSNNDMSILGQYTVNNGKCTLSLKNITKKTFNIQPGSEVLFNGDPMKTSFDATAVYSLRADLTTLDDSFKDNTYLPTTRVNVDCLVKVSGNMDKMDVKYDIVLPNASEELKQQVASLIYSDDIKIREIAYLLGVGAFWAPDNNADKAKGANLWTSLASSTLTNQLNHLLSGVLSENWSIGTDLHASDNSMSDLEMDVNISTHLFNDRLTVTGNLGYRNSSTTNTNFTGDFEADYKLTKSGDVIIKIYNVTNDQYYEQAPTTQGVGIVYKKEAKTFKGLFKKIKAQFKRE